MKNRNLFNNIFTVLIMASLVLFLLAYFEVFGNETVWGWIQKITLPVAMLSAICMEIVLPVIDNKELFKTSSKMKVMVAVKSFLVVLAIVPLVLNISGFMAQNTVAEFGTLAVFVVLYMAQFFINLDPKPETEDEEEEEDEDYEESETDEDVDFEDEEKLEELAEETEEVVEEAEETEEAEEVEEVETETEEVQEEAETTDEETEVVPEVNEEVAQEEEIEETATEEVQEVSESSEEEEEDEE